MKLTPKRRAELAVHFCWAGYGVRTINRRGDVLLAKVRRLDAATNAPYELAQFRLCHDQFAGDYLRRIG